MLVLTRKVEEEIVIGDAETVHVQLTAADRKALQQCKDAQLRLLVDYLLAAQPGEIVVKVVDIRSDKVRLGTTAGRDVPVNRRETYEEILDNPIPAPRPMPFRSLRTSRRVALSAP